MKTFNEYQQFTKAMAVYNEDILLHTKEQAVPMTWAYPSFAIAEEAGEVCGKIAKFIRKSHLGVDLDQLRCDIGDELGDLQFQLSECARQFGFTLQEIIDLNHQKLTSRKERGVLIGEGDKR